jgi:hypothetical protein
MEQIPWPLVVKAHESRSEKCAIWKAPKNSKFLKIRRGPSTLDDVQEVKSTGIEGENRCERILIVAALALMLTGCETARQDRALGGALIEAPREESSAVSPAIPLAVRLQAA